MAISPRLATSTLRNIPATSCESRSGSENVTPIVPLRQAPALHVTALSPEVCVTDAREQHPPISGVDVRNAPIRVGDHLGGRPGWRGAREGLVNETNGTRPGGQRLELLLADDFFFAAHDDV